MKIQQVVHVGGQAFLLGILLVMQGTTPMAANPNPFDENQRICLPGTSCGQFEPSSQGNPVKSLSSCRTYNLNFEGPLEATAYQSVLDNGARNPGDFYVVFSRITPEIRPNWTEYNGTWEAIGPFTLKSGRNHLFEFNGTLPQQIKMHEGSLPYYVEGTASWVQAQNTGWMSGSNTSFAYCLVPASRYHGTTQTSTSSQPITEAIAIRQVMTIPDITQWQDLLAATAPQNSAHIEVVEQTDAYYLFHVYEVVNNPGEPSRTVTYNWYEVDRQTGEISPMFP
ncbi:hypothetical protein AWQ21_07555 [Picosynechococcus sp. PCC 7003]|uniref:hypothetical protein n=1 Tax=Picosynechococcus sp. PCC 7003 TaxID=374981 RepID=UPI000810C002|nr:hypothetical protein [Picosynechococcus sp. PCC 7003]ANV84250.1 hypothetical protein AWQ21_07555 [Picosynechococcus sp. PCC 7003]